jgi:hypothetical protein
VEQTGQPFIDLQLERVSCLVFAERPASMLFQCWAGDDLRVNGGHGLWHGYSPESILIWMLSQNQLAQDQVDTQGSCCPMHGQCRTKTLDARSGKRSDTRALHPEILAVYVVSAWSAPSGIQNSMAMTEGNKIRRNADLGGCPDCRHYLPSKNSLSIPLMIFMSEFLCWEPKGLL